MKHQISHSKTHTSANSPAVTDLFPSRSSSQANSRSEGSCNKLRKYICKSQQACLIFMKLHTVGLSRNTSFWNLQLFTLFAFPIHLYSKHTTAQRVKCITNHDTASLSIAKCSLLNQGYNKKYDQISSFDKQSQMPLKLFIRYSDVSKCIKHTRIQVHLSP